MNEIGLFDVNFDTGERYWSFELPTGLLQDCDAAFSGRLSEALIDRVPRRVRRWPRAVAAHGTASDRA